MKTKISLLIATIFALGMLAFNPNARATTLNFGDVNEVGTVMPDVPQGDQDRVLYVNAMVGLAPGGSTTVTIGTHVNTVNRTLNTFSSLPTVSVVGMVNGMGTSVNVGTMGTFTYLFAHYGGPQGGTSFVWDVASFSGVITIPAGDPYGLSGWSLFKGNGGMVPDGGATVMLLGMAFSGLTLARRFLA